MGLALPPREQVIQAIQVSLYSDCYFQFRVYAGFFLVVGLLFLVTALIELARGGVQRFKTEGVWLGERGREGQGRADPPVGSTECPQ